jgi:methionyl-tRNA formyltransferase
MSGISAHLATEQIDRGAIIGQVPIPLAEQTYSEFYGEIGEAVPTLIDQLEQHFLDGAEPVLHNQGIVSSWFNNNQPEDARIQWLEHSMEEVGNILRTEIAWCVYRTKKLRLLSGDVFAHDPRLSEKAPPGRIMRNGEGVVHIRCMDGWLRLDQWRWERSPFRPPLQSGEMVY